MTTLINPKIYVADLAAYNNGDLHGIWIDVSDDLDSMQQQIQAMLKDSPVEDAEEYAIHDYEGFEGLEISEYASIKTVHEYASFLLEYPDMGAALLNHFNNDIDEAYHAATDGYHGCYTSLADYAQELTEETTEIPQHLQYYIDYERMARDFEMSGDIFTIETAHDEVHIFSNH